MTSHRQKEMKSAHPCLITCTVLGGTPVFSRPEPAQKIIDLWRELQEQGRMVFFSYVLIEDHLSAVVSAGELAKEFALFRTTAAQQVLELLQSQGLSDMLRRLRRFQDQAAADPAARLWQPAEPPAPVYNAEALRAKVDFIHSQPVKRGYVTDATLYRYSSARNYVGQPGLLPVNTDW